MTKHPSPGKAHRCGIDLMERGGKNFMLFRAHGFDKSLFVDVLELAQLYVCRRQIGLAFKELKSHYRLGELSTRKVPMVEAPLLSSIMTFLLSRRVPDVVRKRLRRLCRQVPQGRWASLFDTDSVHILIPPARTIRAFARHPELILLH